MASATASELAELQDDAEHWQPRHKTSLEVATRDFDYEEAVIRLRVGDRTFNVARSRLTQRSPVFREMFSLPQPNSANPPEVALHDDPKFFAAYLWFIHADHLDVLAFNEAPVDDNYLRRWYGVAYTAHKYQANSIATYSIGLALDYLEHVARDEPFPAGATASLLLAVATQWGADSSQGTRARQILRILLYRRAHSDADWSPEDVSDCLVPLEECGDTDLLAHAYYYLLVYRRDTWIHDKRLRPVDRLRLLCGFRELTCAGFNMANNQREGYNASYVHDQTRRLHQDFWPLFYAEELRVQEQDRPS